MSDTEFFWDEGVFRMVSQIERSIVRLQLDSQAQFVSLINAIEVQLESGTPDSKVLRLLFDALLALADLRGADRKSLKLDQRIEKILARIPAHRSS